MTTLITGTGLVGSQIARLEQEKGNKPVIFDLVPNLSALADFVDVERCTVIRADILNQFDLMNAIIKNDITRIVHTVAFPDLTAGCIREPFKSIQLNIMSAVNVLEAARLCGLERVVLCSSSAVPASFTGGEDNGDITREEAYPRTGSIYATTKLTVENLAYNYAAGFGVDAVAVRFSAVFGPWKAGGGGIVSQQMLSALKAVLKGEKATLLDAPIECVYSKDAALGAFKALWATGHKDRIFNIGMGKVFLPEETADIIKKMFPGAQIGFQEMKLGGSKVTQPKPLDLTRAREQLGYVPQYQMEKAIEDLVAWIRNSTQ